MLLKLQGQIRSSVNASLGDYCQCMKMEYTINLHIIWGSVLSLNSIITDEREEETGKCRLNAYKN